MQLQKEVLYLACIHHIHEILLEEAFSITMGPSTGPDVLLFKRFKAFWKNILISKPGIEIQSIATAILDFQLMSVHFAFRQFEIIHQHEDYRELLELTLMFLGRVPPQGISFRKPGAIHRAWFMSRLIYALKIGLFRDAGYKLTKRETQRS